MFTICSANYISYAASLMQSVRRWQPDAARFIVLADTPRAFPGLDLAAELIDCAALEIPLLANMALWYGVTEFNTALKPFACRYFLHRRGVRALCYLDPDTLLFAPLDPVFAALARSSCVLTPHIQHPLQDGREPSDLTILKSGVYNLGFIALRDGAPARRLLDWWAERCVLHCRIDIAGHLFTDQRWLDLAPGFLPGLRILHHPGCNVAYWNLAHRRVTRAADGGWRVGGRPLVFFHFSGIDPDDGASLSRHQDRFSLADIGAAAELCAAFVTTVRANFWAATRGLRYGFGSFADGRPIEPCMRRWLLAEIDAGRRDPQAPLTLTGADFDAPQEGVPGLTRAMHQLWRDRADLRAGFDIATSAGLAAFHRWLHRIDPAAEGIDPRSIAATLRLAAPPSVPFASLATRGWTGPAAMAAEFLAEEVVLLVEAVPFHLPGAVALAWERRGDLRQIYRLDTRASVEDFLAWALTAGIEEGELDPAWIGPRCLAALVAPAAVGALHGDVPITEGMRILRGAGAARAFLPHWQGFPTDRLGRLAHGLWYGLLAPHRLGWPAAMVAPVQAYFTAPSGIAGGGYALNRAALALWELRADLQAGFPLDSDAGVCGFLLWLLEHGLPELALPLACFDPALEAALRRPVPPHGLPGVLDLLYRARADLRAAFAPEDAAGLRAWAETHLAASYAGTMLAELYAPPPLPPPLLSPRHAAIGLTGQLTVASGRGEDVRTAAAALRAAGCVDILLIDRDSDAILDAEGVPLPPGMPVELAVNLVFLNADTAVADWRALRARGVVARRSIGCWAWELARLPAEWRHGFAFYDEIWAASAFAAEAFAAEALRPVRRVPPAVILPGPAAPVRSPNAPTRFLFAFDYRSYIARKNPEAVIAAFHRAFPPHRAGCAAAAEDAGCGGDAGGGGAPCGIVRGSAHRTDRREPPAQRDAGAARRLRRLRLAAPQRGFWAPAGGGDVARPPGDPHLLCRHHGFRDACVRLCDRLHSGAGATGRLSRCRGPGLGRARYRHGGGGAARGA